MVKAKFKSKNLMFSCFFILILSTLANNKQISVVNSSDENFHSQTDELNSEGGEWSLTEVIELGTASGNAYPYFVEADDVGNLHLLWSVHSDEIYYKIWFAENQSWSENELVYSGTYRTYTGDLDSNNNMHIAYIDSSRDCYYKFRSASTGLWSTPEMVYNADDDSTRLAIACDVFGNVHFLWEEITEILPDTEYDIFLNYRKMHSNGTWDSLLTINSLLSWFSGTSVYRLDIVTNSNGNVRITYINGSSSVYFQSWYYSTQLWSSTEIINPSGYGGHHTLNVDPKDNIHCIWTDSSNDYYSSGADADLFHRYWNITSQTWSSITTVSTESRDTSIYASLDSDIEGNLYVTWTDTTDYMGSGNNPNIFYKEWSVDSQLWSLTEIVSSESLGWAGQSQIAVDQVSNVHCVWIDNSDYGGGTGYSNVFYKNKQIIVEQPLLAVILPNPSENGIINLVWSDVDGISHYNVYKSTSFIFDVDSLSPIASVLTSEYIDTISTDGIYFYVIEAVSILCKTQSQCEYVEVVTPPLAAPILVPIYPNPTDDGTILVDWNDVSGASEYYIYRSSSYIWEADERLLDAVISASMSEIYDGVASEGFYYYAVVAVNGSEKSAISNCVFVYYQPSVQTTPEETSLGISVLGIVGIIGIAALILKKRN